MSEKLDLKLEIYLPAKYDLNDKFQRDLVNKLTETFGGLTILPNNYGTWLKSEKDSEIKSLTHHKIIHDNITILRIYTTKRSRNLNIDSVHVFYKTIERIKEYYDQNSVAFTINDVMEFY